MVRHLTIIFLFLISILPTFADEDRDPNPFGLPDRVMALPKELRAGQVFQGYPKLNPMVKWYALPSGLAGNWISKEQRIMRSDDFQTGAYYTVPSVEAAEIVEHLGDLKDADGTIWHALITPEIHDYQKQNYIDTQNTISTKMLEQSPDYVLIWSRVFHVVYEPQSLRIVTSYTEEKVCQFNTSSSGRLIGDAYIRIYDADGYVQMSAQTLRTFVVNSPFRPVSERAGLGLYNSLASHLQNIGRHDLIGW